MKPIRIIATAMTLAAIIASGPAANATTETETSPTGGALPSGVTKVGGIVVDLTGTNGTRVVSQLSASSLYAGYANANPLTIGTQNGFDSTVLSALGGGLQSAAFRVTLYDGDTAPGDFDYNENTFLVNGVNVGNWSNVATVYTNDAGTVNYSSGTGFGNDILSTGFFTLSDATKLATLFSTLTSTGAMAFTLNDVDPYDNYYDFTQGVAGGLINVGTGPVITPGTGAVPEPATWAMMILGFGVVGGALRRRRATARVTFA